MELFKLLGTIAIEGTDKAKNDINDTTNTVNNAESKMTSALKKIGVAVITYFATDKIKAFGSEIINVTASFEDSMLKVQSLSGATTDEYNKLSEAALHYGSTTAWTSKDVADAMGYMALAGFNTNEILESISGMLSLASASGENLATVTDILTDSMTALGDSASDASRYADVLATTQAKSNTTVEKLGEAFKYVAPLAGSYGYKLEDVATALGMMANAGVKGTIAGTSLSTLMTRLATDAGATSESYGALGTLTKKLGVEFYNTDGSARNLSDLLKDMCDATKDLTVAEKSEIANKIAGLDAQKGLLAILNQGSDAYAELESSVKSCDGTAQSMAENMESGVGGAIRSFKSATEGLKISIGKVFSKDTNGLIKDMANWISNKLTPKAVEFSKKGLNKIKDVMGWISKNMPKINNLFKKSGEILSKLLGKVEPILQWILSDGLPVFLDLLGFLVNHFELIVGIGTTLLGVLKGFKIISTLTTAIQGASGAFGAFNAVLSANPIGAVVTSVGLLAAGIGILVTAMQEEETETEKSKRLAEERTKKYEEETQAIINAKEATREKATEELAEVENVESLWKELQTLCDETGKVKDADKARANFILNELNNALGTEYTMTGNQIQNYKNLQSEIDKTIQKKRAEIELSAAEEDYNTAIKNRVDKENELQEVLQKVADQQKVCYEINEQFAEMQRKYQNEEISRKEWEDFIDKANAATETLKGYKNDLESVKTGLKEYYTSIATYENAQAAMLAGNTDEAIRILESKNSAYLKAADIAGQATKEQMQVFEQQVIDAGVKMGMMQNMLDNCAEEEKATYEKLYKDAANNFEEMKKQYVAAGGDAAKSFQNEINFKLRGFSNDMKNIGADITNNVADGMKSNQGALANSLRSNGKFLGTQYANGMTEGVNEGQEFFKKALGNLIAGGVSFVKKIAKIHSPSRLFAEEIGAYIPSGIGMGVEDNEGDALSPMQNMINDMTLPSSNISKYANINPTINNNLSNNTSIESKLDQVVNAIRGLKIYLNGDMLVGELTPAIDAQLGQIYVGKERGR